MRRRIKDSFLILRSRDIRHDDFSTYERSHDIRDASDTADSEGSIGEDTLSGPMEGLKVSDAGRLRTNPSEPDGFKNAVAISQCEPGLVQPHTHFLNAVSDSGPGSATILRHRFIFDSANLRRVS
jgi:hypothetical protein